MSRATAAGTTDYRHQSFIDIQKDIVEWIDELHYILNLIDKNIKLLEEANYWETVPFDIQSIIIYARKFYRTTENELSEILLDTQHKVEKHHVVRLERVGDMAYEINIRWGTNWHRNNPREYDKDEFRILEEIYAKGRDVAAGLLDLSNVAERLADFVGRKNTDKVNTSNIPVHPNIEKLLIRLNSALRDDDYPNVLHTSASIFETLAKDIVNLDTIQDQTLKSFFARYRKDSGLPNEILDYIQSIYDARSTTPLAAHGSTKIPIINKKEAITLAEITKAFVRIEYLLRD